MKIENQNEKWTGVPLPDDRQGISEDDSMRAGGDRLRALSTQVSPLLLEVLALQKSCDHRSRHPGQEESLH
jgi:hypothetical protein